MSHNIVERTSQDILDYRLGAPEPCESSTRCRRRLPGCSRSPARARLQLRLPPGGQPKTHRLVTYTSSLGLAIFLFRAAPTQVPVRLCELVRRRGVRARPAAPTIERGVSYPPQHLVALPSKQSTKHKRSGTVNPPPSFPEAVHQRAREERDGDLDARKRARCLALHRVAVESFCEVALGEPDQHHARERRGGDDERGVGRVGR